MFVMFEYVRIGPNFCRVWIKGASHNSSLSLKQWASSTELPSSELPVSSFLSSELPSSEPWSSEPQSETHETQETQETQEAPEQIVKIRKNISLRGRPLEMSYDKFLMLCSLLLMKVRGIELQIFLVFESTFTRHVKYLSDQWADKQWASSSELPSSEPRSSEPPSETHETYETQETQKTQ